MASHRVVPAARSRLGKIVANLWENGLVTVENASPGRLERRELLKRLADLLQRLLELERPSFVGRRELSAEAPLAQAESYVRYRVRLEIDRAADRQEAFVRVREILAKVEDSPERQEALRLASDRLDLPRETQAGLAPARGAARGATPALSPRVLEAGERLERDALAGVIAHQDALTLLAELTPDHFDDETHRRVRAHLVKPGEAERDLLPLLAELDARAAAEGIDGETTKELLIRLRERHLRRELANADLDRTKEIQETLERLRAAAANLV